jgi:hypothetical protein
MTSTGRFAIRDAGLLGSDNYASLGCCSASLLPSRPMSRDFSIRTLTGGKPTISYVPNAIVNPGGLELHFTMLVSSLGGHKFSEFRIQFDGPSDHDAQPHQ